MVVATRPIDQVSEPQHAILEARTPFNLFMGGQGIGKTNLMFRLAFMFMCFAPKAKGFIGANTHRQLSDSTLTRFFEELNAHGIHPYNDKTKEGDYVVRKQPPAHFTVFHRFSPYTNIISFSNGHVIIIGAFREWKPLEGIEISYALVDEAGDVPADAITQMLIGRMRQFGLCYVNVTHTIEQPGTKQPITVEKNTIVWYEHEAGATLPPQLTAFNPIYLLTSPKKSVWLNEFFELNERREEIIFRCRSKTDFYFQTDDVQTVVVASTYHNEHNLPPGRIEISKKKLKTEAEIDRVIFANPFIITGGEYLPSFNQSVHVQACKDKFTPNTRLLYLGWDFNVRPYTTCLVMVLDVLERFSENTNGHRKSDIKRAHLYVIDEICLFPTVAQTVEELKKRYPQRSDYEQKFQIIYGGDPTGGSTTAGLNQGENPYGVLTKPDIGIPEYLSVVKDIQVNLTRWPITDVQIMPGIAARGQWLDACLAGTLPLHTDGFDLQITVDPSCKELIKDMTNSQKDDKGDIIINTKTENKVREEENGHCISALAFFTVQRFRDIYFNFFLKEKKLAAPAAQVTTRTAQNVAR